ncbi:S-adenosyl-L-methionine-dependent methyltransferase [Pisolithus marmoratus]|nr:S-adenosyl-L-methionine-dependent methyltransferase [Pisolithus marmoratus]
MRLNYPVVFPLNQISFVGEDDSQYFCQLYGRRFNVLSQTYPLPADEEEVRRSELYHKILQFLFDGKSYVGPMKEVLTPREGKERCRILDLGTGGGFWYADASSTLSDRVPIYVSLTENRAIDLADEFPTAEVIGVDLAPLQPREVPENCTFELCDLDQFFLPYPSEHFDVIHARFMHTGISNYPRFLNEIARMLRPGGLVILVEPDPEPIADGKTATELARSGQPSGMRGWFTLWEAYAQCLRDKGIDVKVPAQLPTLLTNTRAFDKIVTQEGNIPIGFWPKDPVALTIGQLAWMNYDIMLPALKPLFLSAGMKDWEAKKLIEEAHQDLYYPLVRPSTRLHIVHAIKKATSL